MDLFSRLGAGKEDTKAVFSAAFCTLAGSKIGRLGKVILSVFDSMAWIADFTYFAGETLDDRGLTQEHDRVTC